MSRADGGYTRDFPFVAATRSSLPSGPINVGELRRLARAAGIPIGDARADDEDREWTAKHEAAHAAVAHALGWTVESVDVVSGQTRTVPPALQDQSLAEKDLQHAVIAAAGAAFTGAHSDGELEADRFAVRLRGFTRWEEARAKAERLTAEPYVKALYERLTDALLKHDRLEGEQLARVLVDPGR
jgi:hypothetical protein